MNYDLRWLGWLLCLLSAGIVTGLLLAVTL